MSSAWTCNASEAIFCDSVAKAFWSSLASCRIAKMSLNYQKQYAENDENYENHCDLQDLGLHASVLQAAPF
jgi:hypothetical protein